jgi:protein regulator of cytokinesis 1
MDSSRSKSLLSSPTVKFMLNEAQSPSVAGISMLKSPQNTSSSNLNTSQMNRSQVTAFTPIMTPKGDHSGSMVLLSPSRTITETLTTLVSSTGHQLEEVWEEVGYSPEDRASQLSDLLVRFRDICEEKIAEEKGVAETFHQTIREAKEEMQRTGEALKALVDPQLLKDNTGQTLTDELATLEAALEGLRTAANTAKEDLEQCRTFLIEAHEALGTDMDPKWRDIESDLTAARLEEFHRRKAEMKEELSTRTAAIIQLVRDCQHLLNDLRMEPEHNGTPLDRRIAGSLVRSKDGSFIMASKFQGDTCTGLNSKAMEALTDRVTELHGEKRRRKSKLQEMGADIAMLWEKLRVPEEEQIAFTESVQGLGLDTIEKGKSELARMHALKSEKIGNLIEEAREAISSLWDQINATPEQRRCFASFYVQMESQMNDELLDKHEQYICTLQSRLEQMKPILRLIERREVVVRERQEYEELQKDSDRLKQRGAAMTRQLMEEEKMARRIKRDLPKLTEMLAEKLHEWKETHAEDFQFGGEVYLAVMDQQEEEWDDYKNVELQKKLKKKQEEKTFVENRYATASVVGVGPPAGKKKATTRPLGDAKTKENKNNPSRSRSHDTRKPAPDRAIGTKQTSLKF